MDISSHPQSRVLPKHPNEAHRVAHGPRPSARINVRPRSAGGAAVELGHSSLAITLQVYAHLFRKDDSKAAAAINAALKGRRMTSNRERQNQLAEFGEVRACRLLRQKRFS